MKIRPHHHHRTRPHRRVACGVRGRRRRQLRRRDRFEGAGEQVAIVVDDLQSASREADTKAICRELFTAAHAARVASGAGTSYELKAKQEIAVPDKND